MKRILPLLLALISLQAVSQLRITEISYNPPEAGTDSTEFIEIHNNTSSAIDLSNYTFSAGVVHTFYAGETIAAGGYYVIAVDSVAMLNTYGTVADAQWTSGGLSNGGEPIALKDAGGVLVDSLRYDDVNPWPTDADGNGPSIVLCDLAADQEVGGSWQVSQTSAGITVNGKNVFGSPGSADGACSADTLASITSVDASVFENVGTVNVTIELSQAPVLDKTVDLTLTSGNAAVLGNYTTQTVTFTGGSTSEIVTITVTQGQLVAASEVFDFSLGNPSTGLILGSDIDFELTVNEMPTGPAPCTEIFFSEYIESTSSKALEIYNPTTSIVDLSIYEIRRYSNGASTPTSTLSMTGNVTPGDVYVIAHASGADPAILAEADITSGIANFNGDDAVELYNTVSGTSVDIIGEIGVDPGTSWGVGSDSTENVTMVRMATVSAGNIVWTGGSNGEWDTYGLNEYSYIGSHTNSGCALPATPTAVPVGSLSYCLGDTVFLTHNSFGGLAPYSVAWSVGGVPVSTDDTLIYEALTSTTLSVTLTVTDDNSVVDDSVFNVTIKPLPTPGFTLSTPTLCAEDTTWITGTGSGTGMLTYAYVVDPTGILNTNVGGDGHFTSDSDGTYVITQTLSDFSGCSDTVSHTVTVNALDDASFSTLPDVCADDILSLTHSNPAGIWSGTGVTDNGSGDGEFTSSSSGDFVITYTTTGTCPDEANDTVEVFELPVAAYTFTGSITVDFTDASTGSSLTYLWDLGDGNTSTQQNPTHTYDTDGNYTVCLTVTNPDGCTDSVCQAVTIAGTSITEFDGSNVSFFPNPTSDVLTIQSVKPVGVTIFSVIGQQVYKQRLKSNETISLAHLERGSYFIQFELNGETLTEKLIIK